MEKLIEYIMKFFIAMPALTVFMVIFGAAVIIALVIHMVIQVSKYLNGGNDDDINFNSI